MNTHTGEIVTRSGERKTVGLRETPKLWHASGLRFCKEDGRLYGTWAQVCTLDLTTLKPKVLP